MIRLYEHMLIRETFILGHVQSILLKLITHDLHRFM